MCNLIMALTRAKESLIVCGNFQYVCTEVGSMPSTWLALLTDARLRGRFLDTNGAFNSAQISNILLST